MADGDQMELPIIVQGDLVKVTNLARSPLCAVGRVTDHDPGGTLHEPVFKVKFKDGASFWYFESELERA